MTNIRPSPIAGTWYPGDAYSLAAEVTSYLERAEPKVPRGRILGIVVPHAAYRYSGAIAAFAFKCVQGSRPEVVVVLSPLHATHPAAVLTSAHSAYQTPLGPVGVDSALLHRVSRRIEESLGKPMFPILCDREHSVEIELPFLQVAIGSFRLLPIMIRDQSAEVAEAVGRALAQELEGQKALFVASSDLSHHRPEREARTMDYRFLSRLLSFDPVAVVRQDDLRTAAACGRGAIAAALWATREMGANRVTLLKEGTSAQATGDERSVVGYASAVIWQSEHRAGPLPGLAEAT
ncbi:MAG TPA: AmmeMemoRadiSam system protein B [Spirochaetia bacterium]|nr:AmmeMemoRadiSam system protein B [Spirochaetia bacterium]